MEVINPIIIVGGGKTAAAANNFCEMRMMLSDHTQNIPIVRYSAVAKASGPLLHILRPGNYTLNGNEMNTEILQEYGIIRGTFKRLYIAANICMNDTNTYLNLCGIFNKSYDADYMSGFYYVDQHLYERALPIVLGVEGRAAVPLTSLYAGYCEAGLISLADLKRNWREYTTLNVYYMLLEE